MNWPALPFVRLILPFVVGIYSGICYPSFSIIPIAVSFVLPALFLLILLAKKRLKYRKRRWHGLVLSALLLSLGYLITFFKTPRHSPDHFSHDQSQLAYWQFNIESIKPGPASIRLQGRVSATGQTDGELREASGGLLLYVRPDSLSRSLVAGDELLVRSQIQELEAPKNPKAFDFSAYMARQGIYHRAFAASGEWQKTGHQGRGYRGWVENLRHSCTAILSRYLTTDHEFAIGAALLTGQRSLVSEDIREAYIATGAVHVLAVSGLHIGIIYLGLSSLLNLIGWKGWSRRWSRSFFLLAGIWFFALFTGGSPSVLRAASMFSFVIMGEALYRRHNLYNTLAASAFMLLGLQPYLLLDIGFQLSYLAVSGIVFFQGRIYRLWYIAHPLGDYLWKLTSVSLAAQLTTLPISLFYFHQFPLYFWLSGWIVVPGAMVVLLVGIALLILHPVGFLAGALGSLLNGVIWLMNTSILFIQQLPAGLITGIWLSIGMLSLWYAALTALMSGLYRKRLKPVRIALVCLILMGCRYNWVKWQSQRQQTLAIYHLKDHSCIDFFDGERAFSLSDLPETDDKLQMAAGNFRDFRKIRELDQYSYADTVLQKGNVFRWNNFLQLGPARLAIVDKLPPVSPPEPLAVDYILLRNNPRLRIANLVPYFSCKTVVFDASNSRSRVNYWKEECQKLDQLYHDIDRQGALVVNLESTVNHSR